MAHESVQESKPVRVAGQRTRRPNAAFKSLESVTHLEVERGTKGPGYHAFGQGLYIRTTKAGTRSWTLIYTRNGRTRELGLGGFPAVSLARVRELVAEAREALARGEDPIDRRHEAARAAEHEAREKQAKEVTFEQCAAKYITAHRAGWRNAKHAAQWEATLATYAGPLIGRMPVGAVTKLHVLRVLEQPVDPDDPNSLSLWEGRPETASRLRGRIESVLAWARGRGLCEGENPAAWKGNLSALLPAKSKVKKSEHHAALPVADMPSFMAELRRRPSVSARALEFQCLTATRTGEVIGADWSEVDLEAATWTIPKERMKAGKEHKVSLSPRALEILRAMPHREGFVFPGGKPGKGLSNAALSELMKDMRPGVTVHGTARSTFRDWAAENTSFSREAVEMSLAHAIGDKVEAAYRRGDLFKKRRALMNAWASYCQSEFLRGTGSVKLLVVEKQVEAA